MQDSSARTVAGYKPGGFWERFTAYLVDSIIVFFGLLLVRLCLWVLSFWTGDIFSRHILFTYSVRDIILYGCSSLYFVLITYFTGTTVGKMIFSLKVVSVRRGKEKPGFIDILYRETVGRFLCKILFIGYIFVAFDKEKRGFHDMLCDTRVVEVHVRKPPLIEGGSNETNYYDGI